MKKILNFHGSCLLSQVKCNCMQLPIPVHFGSNLVQPTGQKQPKQLLGWLTAFLELRLIAKLIRNQQVEMSWELKQKTWNKFWIAVFFIIFLAFNKFNTLRNKKMWAQEKCGSKCSAPTWDANLGLWRSRCENISLTAAGKPRKSAHESFKPLGYISRVSNIFRVHSCALSWIYMDLCGLIPYIFWPY